MIEKDKRLFVIVTIAVVVLLVVWLVFVNSGDEDIDEGTVVITNSDGEEVEVEVEVADEKEERREGLMHRESLCEDCGMLFVYQENVLDSFWMKNTEIPLSIAFISEDGTINEIQQMEPNTTDPHTPSDRYRYALEVNQGFFQENDIDAGDQVSIPEEYTS